MELKELIGAFAAEAGIKETPVAHDAGGFTFEIDDITISFVETEGSHELVTLAVVGELPDSGEKQIFRYLMEAMFRDGGSGGAIFSLEPGTKRIWAHRRDSLATMDEEGFRAMLERFVNGMEEWRRIVSGLSELAPKLAEAEQKVALESRNLQLGSGDFMRV